MVKIQRAGGNFSAGEDCGEVMPFMRQLLDVFDHFPYAAGTDARAKAAAYAPVFIHDIFVRSVLVFNPADGPLVTGRLAHFAVAAFPA